MIHEAPFLSAEQKRDIVYNNTVDSSRGVDVHDLFVFGYSAWAILIGVQLWRQAPPVPAA